LRGLIKFWWWSGGCGLRKKIGKGAANVGELQIQIRKLNLYVRDNWGVKEEHLDFFCAAEQRHFTWIYTNHYLREIRPIALQRRPHRNQKRPRPWNLSRPLQES
jgi:hypothetical protein